MQWDEFVSGLKTAKAEKKLKGLSIGSISNLLFAGAMDSMLPKEDHGSVDAYKKRYEELKSALKSKASLTKKKKTEMIGLSDVKGPVDLSLWRDQVNPLSTFNIIESCKESLKDFGYTETVPPHPSYPMIRKADKEIRKTRVLSPYWSGIFKSRAAMDAFESGLYELAIFGVIVDVSMKTYSNGEKERLCFKVYSGVECTDEIVIWPEKDGKISEHYKSRIKPMAMGIAVVRPKIWNGRNGASLASWQDVARS